MIGITCYCKCIQQRSPRIGVPPRLKIPVDSVWGKLQLYPGIFWKVAQTMVGISVQRVRRSWAGNKG